MNKQHQKEERDHQYRWYKYGVALLLLLLIPAAALALYDAVVAQQARDTLCDLQGYCCARQNQSGEAQRLVAIYYVGALAELGEAAPAPMAALFEPDEGVLSTQFGNQVGATAIEAFLQDALDQGEFVNMSPEYCLNLSVRRVYWDYKQATLSMEYGCNNTFETQPFDNDRAGVFRFNCDGLLVYARLYNWMAQHTFFTTNYTTPCNYCGCANASHHNHTGNWSDTAFHGGGGASAAMVAVRQQHSLAQRRAQVLRQRGWQLVLEENRRAFPRYQYRPGDYERTRNNAHPH